MAAAMLRIGLTEEQATAMETAMKSMVVDAQQLDRGLIEGLPRELANLRGGGRAAGGFDLLDNGLGKPLPFNGHESKWEQWYFKFRAYALCMGGNYIELIAVAEGTGEVSLEQMNEQQQVAARRLYLALVMLTEDSAMRLVQSVRDSNGTEALRHLLKRYNPYAGPCVGDLEQHPPGRVERRRKRLHGQAHTVGAQDR